MCLGAGVGSRTATPSLACRHNVACVRLVALDWWHRIGGAALRWDSRPGDVKRCQAAVRLLVVPVVASLQAYHCDMPGGMPVPYAHVAYAGCMALDV